MYENYNFSRQVSPRFLQRTSLSQRSQRKVALFLALWGQSFTLGFRLVVVNLWMGRLRGYLCGQVNKYLVGILNSSAPAAGEELGALVQKWVDVFRWWIILRKCFDWLAWVTWCLPAFARAPTHKYSLTSKCMHACGYAQTRNRGANGWTYRCQNTVSHALNDRSMHIAKSELKSPTLKTARHNRQCGQL